MLKITSEEARSILQDIYKTQDKEGLHEFILDFFGVNIPTKKVCKDHDAPMDFVADIFFQSVKNVIAVANRLGGKTLDFAILDALNWYYWDNCEIAGVGAIEAQALKCYGYFSGYVNKTPLFRENLQDSLMSKTKGVNGSLVQILTGTMSGVNSPHPHKALLDEVELMLWNVLQEAFSMAKSSDEIVGQTIITSTRKFAFGPMERLLKEAVQRGLKKYIWCIRETIEPHHISQTKGTNIYEDLKDHYDKDGNFPSDGYLKVQDVISARGLLDDDTWNSQWMCKKPMSQALVYPQFDAVIHMRPLILDKGSRLVLAEDFGFAKGHADVIGFWQSFSGKAKLVDEIWIEGKTDDELVLMVFQKLIEMGYCPQRYLDTLKKGYKEYTDLAEFIRDLDPNAKVILNKAISIWYCPPEEPSKIAIRQRYGFNVTYQEDMDKRKLEYGIPIIRQKLQHYDELGEPMIQFDTKCIGTTGEMGIYSNQIRADGTILDTPAKKNDNGPDMIRYFIINEMPIESSTDLTQLNKENPQHERSKPITSGLADETF